LYNGKSDISRDWSEWDFILLNGPIKVYESIDKIEEKYGVIIKSIHSGKSMSYNKNDSKEMRILKLRNYRKK
jgi:hypothetical protein